VRNTSVGLERYADAGIHVRQQPLARFTNRVRRHQLEAPGRQKEPPSLALLGGQLPTQRHNPRTDWSQFGGE
jgi:hypothetical protein